MNISINNITNTERDAYGNSSDRSLIAQNNPVILNAPQTSEIITAGSAPGAGMLPVNIEIISKDFFYYLHDKHIKDFYKNAENKNYKTGLYTFENELTYCDDKDLAAITYYARPEMRLEELYWHFKEVAHLSDKDIERLFKRLFKEAEEFNFKRDKSAGINIIKIESGYFGKDGVLKFIDIVHVCDFFGLLKLECQGKNLLPLYEEFYKGSGYKKHLDSLTDCARFNNFKYNLSENINNINFEGVFLNDITTTVEFRNLVVRIHKITTLRGFSHSPYLQNLDFKDWPPSQQNEFINACHANMTKDKYALFFQQVKDMDIKLPDWDQIKVWCGKATIANPAESAIEMRSCGRFEISPPTRDEAELHKFFTPDLLLRYARGELVLRWAYIDNVKDANGVLIPNICLVPNNFSDLIYFYTLKYNNTICNNVNDAYSPASVKELCDIIDEWNFPERKGFSYLDKAIIPALSEIDTNVAVDTLLEFYGIFIAARQFRNPISITRFFAGMSLLPEDIKRAIWILKYGTRPQKALLAGQLIGMLFGYKMCEETAIVFENSKIKLLSKAEATGNPEVYFIGENPEGFITVINSKGEIYIGDRVRTVNEQGRVCEDIFIKKADRAPKSQRPTAKIKDEEPLTVKPAAKELLPQKTPIASVPAPKPRHAVPQSAGAASPLSATLPKLYQSAGKIDPFKPVSDALETFAAMIVDAARIRALSVNNNAGILSGSRLPKQDGNTAPSNLPTFTAPADLNLSKMQNIEIALGDSNHVVRLKAVYEAGEIGYRAKALVPALIIRLNDENFAVRTDTIDALGKIGPYAKDAIPELITRFSNNDSLVRRKSAVAVGKIGPDAIPALIEELKKYNYLSFPYAAYALGENGRLGRGAVPAFIRGLSNENPRIREASEYGLVKIGLDAIPALEEEALNGTNANARNLAKRILDKIKQ